jgi:hypothetical protein
VALESLRQQRNDDHKVRDIAAPIALKEPRIGH